jgi:tetratricopeptide (TPR) repeat protein
MPDCNGDDRKRISFRMWFTASAVIFGTCLLLGFGVVRAQQTGDEPSVVRESARLRSGHHLQAAADVLQKYLAAHGDDADVLIALAQIRADEGDTEAEKDLLWRALRASPNSPPANLTLGNLLFHEHHDPEAMDRFETVLAIDLRNAAARHGELAAVTELAERMRQLGHPELALKALQHAQTKLPDDPQLLLDLGIQETELGDTSDALEAVHAARKLRPDDPTILYALAHAQFQAQQMADAEQSFRAYLKVRPNDASAHFGLGRVLEVTQQPAEARAEFQRSIELQPVQTESYYELADMELKAGHDDAAEELLRKTLARDRHHGGALTDMGEICFQRKQYDDAERWLEQALSAAPEYAPAHYYHGLVLAKLGRKDESARELREATELDRKQQGPPPTSAAAPRTP